MTIFVIPRTYGTYVSTNVNEKLLPALRCANLESSDIHVAIPASTDIARLRAILTDGSMVFAQPALVVRNHAPGCLVELVCVFLLLAWPDGLFQSALYGAHL